MEKMFFVCDFIKKCNIFLYKIYCLDILKLVRSFLSFIFLYNISKN